MGTSKLFLKNYTLLTLQFVVLLTSLNLCLNTKNAQADMALVETDKIVDTANDFRQSAIQYLEELSQLGILSIQGKTIDTIIDNISKISIIVQKEVKYENNDLLNSSRNCAYWDRENNTIVVSSTNWQKLDPLQKKPLAAHEVFGFVGINDAQFELTSLSSTYFAVERIARRNPVIKPKSLGTFKEAIITNPRLINELRGGVTGVGGGGDLRPLHYKSALMHSAFESFNFNDIDEALFLDLIKMYQQINIEFSDNVPQGSYFFESKSLTLFIPNNPFTAENSSDNFKAVLLFHGKIVKYINSERLKNE